MRARGLVLLVCGACTGPLQTIEEEECPSELTDLCGVCDADPGNDCDRDCGGVDGGVAFIDECGSCAGGTTGRVACTQDCLGVWGGLAQVDNCGICDADATNDCPYDCLGVRGGTARRDGCGTCDNDSTNDCRQDCANVWGGVARLDECSRCVEGTTGLTACVQDCAGVWGGAAVRDNCGTCDADVANDCDADCFGVPGGSATRDGCGVCDSEPANDCTRDCANVWGGSARLDNCGRCVGGVTGLSSCAQDCSGTWGGAAYTDGCGRCVGGATGLVACTGFCVGKADGTACGDSGSSCFVQDTCQGGFCVDRGLAGECRPGQQTTGASCGNCGVMQATCSTSCAWPEPACTVNGSCAPPADVESQLRRSCYCIDCNLADVDAAHEARCAYLRWTFFPWGGQPTRAYFDGTVRPVAQAARTRGMVAEYGIPEYLASPTPAQPCPADRRIHFEVDVTKVAAWNAILLAHRPLGSIQTFSPVGTDLSFNLDQLWAPGPNPNWVYGVCAGVPSLASDEGWRYHLYVVLAALDAGVGGLYLSQVGIRGAPAAAHVVALIAAARAYSQQLHPGAHLVVGGETVFGLGAGQLDYRKDVLDVDVASPVGLDGSSWPAELDSDGADTQRCYAPNLLEDVASTGTDTRTSSCAAPQLRTGPLCIGDSDRRGIRAFAHNGAYQPANDNFRIHHEEGTPVMLELDGFQQCAYRTSRYTSAGITDGVLPIFYKPNLCGDYDQTTCVANVRNGLPNTMLFLSQPAARRRAFLAYGAKAARLLTRDTGVPHYFPQPIRMDQNLTAVARDTALLSGATSAELSQASLVRYCPEAETGPGKPLNAYNPYQYAASDCGDLPAITAAFADAAGAEAAAARGFVEHAYRVMFARAPDAAGLAYWSGSIASATDREAAALYLLRAFAAAPGESLTTAGATEYTSRLFRGAVGREPQASELAALSGQPRATQVDSVLASYACRRHLRSLGLRSAPLNQGFYVSTLYTMIARAQEAITAPEVEWWSQQLFMGATTPAAAALAFVQGEESENNWNAICAAWSVCHDWFVHEAYTALLHHPPDPGGLAFWAEQLRTGAHTRATFVNALVSIQEFADRMTRLGLQ